MTENSAIFNARHGAGSFHPHRQLAPTAQDCLKRGNGANWRMTRQLSGECRIKHLEQAIDEGKKGHADQATTHAEAALNHLQQVN